MSEQLPRTDMTLNDARDKLAGWHFAQETLGERERAILYVAEAVLRALDATEPLTVFLVRGECGDYYCGCGGGHVAAVAFTEAEAERLRVEAASAVQRYHPDGRDYKLFPNGVTVVRVPVGSLIPREP